MAGMQIRSFWLAAPGRAEIRTETLRDPAPGEVLVRTLFTGISRGTETLVYQGAVPPSEHERMRAPLQEGHFPAPVKYGYCNVGVVEHGPPALLGRAVFTLAPHQTHFVAPEDAVHPLPEGLSPQRAVLAANLETAVNGIWDAGAAVGDRIAVVGGGTVGCLVAWLAARVPGTRVELIDIDPARRQTAEALGVAFKTPADASGDADLVIHASATEAGLATALSLAGFEATVLELSWFGTRTPAVPLGAAFHSKRLRIKSSQVGHVPPGRRARWTHAARMRLALELLADPVHGARLDALVTGESPFETLPHVLHELATGTRAALCHRIAYS
jgi:threonine dehydrogenase-like Zn-dependent dehydrogenase